MESRIWHRSYPPGIAADAPLEEGLTLTAMIDRSIERYPERVAFSVLGVDLTYRELDRLADGFSRYLLQEGMMPGDHVALMLPNGLEYPVCAIGVLRAGMAVVSVNPMYTARELAHQLQDSGAKAIVAGEALLPLVHQVQGETLARHVVFTNAFRFAPGAGLQHAHTRPIPQGAISLGDALKQGAEAKETRPAVRDSDIAFLQYTGGTTGPSKGAALSHANVMAGVIQQATWLRAAFVPGDTVCVTPLPLYHIFALNIMLMSLLVGAANRLVPNPRDMTQLVGELKRAPFHVLPAVNTLLNALLNSGLLLREDFASTRLVIGAGASVLESVGTRWKEVTGIPLTEGYGLTECSPGVTFNLIGAGWTGSIGMPFPSTDVKIMDSEGRTASIGTAGELCVKGPQVFSGYWRRPEETQKVFTGDGWFRTGDVATMDERGMFKIVDRLKDMILVSAFNVYPNEIEAVVTMMPSVVECACVGVPDDRTGEAPHLFVVRRAADLDAAQIISHCKANLTAYKVPRHISFVDALPKSPVVKILRRELRDRLAPASVAT